MNKEKEKTSSFDNFLKIEYEKIAEAHFETASQVTQFFRYYLLVISAPSIILIFLDNQIESIKIIDSLFSKSPSTISNFIAIIFFVLSCLGFLICLHIISLRHDSILYARHINGIRKYFFDKAELDFRYEVSIRALPKIIKQPNYFEKHLFLPILFSFAFVNSIYFILSFLIFFSSKIVSATLIFVLLFVFHIVIYKYLSAYRENCYMKSRIIGFDIDGVLNKHREHFSSILKKVVGKDLDPNNIVKIPVHKDEKLNITLEDEQKVFHDLHYWQEMPPIENDLSFLKNLSIKYKIFVFTDRKWPNDSFLKNNIIYKEKWDNISITDLTKIWLKKHNFLYDKLFIETPHKKFLYFFSINSKNRFQISQKYKIQYFVEDNVENAKILSEICEAVFLVNHPYNKESDKLPSNIKRIDSLNEISKYLIYA